MSEQPENSLAAEAKEYAEAVISTKDHTIQGSVRSWVAFKKLAPKFREAVALHGIAAENPEQTNIFYSAFASNLKYGVERETIARQNHLSYVVDVFSSLNHEAQKKLIEGLPSTLGMYPNGILVKNYEQKIHQIKAELLRVYGRHFERKHRQHRAGQAPVA